MTDGGSPKGLARRVHVTRLKLRRKILARSAAPERISAKATVKILTASGYKVAAQGSNGFVCMVQRGWAAPSFTLAPNRGLVYYSKLRAPICFDPVASRTVVPYQELRAEPGMQGKDPDAIASGVAMAYATGKLPKMEGVAFAYMWSGAPGPGSRRRRVASTHDDLRSLL
jgi:hypothetical protein